MSERYDLLVIGGGINGAAIARDAAGRGLSVLVAEQGDPAGATSSVSSKLIHGGLRYLEHYDFRLVRESLHERDVMLRIAPQLTRITRFVIPHSPEQRPFWMLRAGLWLYDRLGSGGLPAAQGVGLRGTPWGAALREEFRSGLVYSDVQVDDARLTILTLRDAVAHGAQVLDRSRFVAARRLRGVWHVTLDDCLGGKQKTLSASAIVNAAGPWAGEVACCFGGASKPSDSLRLVRGSHIVVPRLYPGEHAYTLQNSDGRVVFMLPFCGGFTLVGTTDIVTETAWAQQPSDAEIDYLCAAVNRYSRQPLHRDAIVWQFSGVRPLIDDGSTNPAAVSRDYRLRLDSDGGTLPALSVFGGKLTTHRLLAERVLDRLRPFFPAMTGHWTAKAPLPGGDLPPATVLTQLAARHPALPEDWLAGLVARHGSGATALLEGVHAVTDLGNDFGGGLYQREVQHFIAHEWAREADDILWRRSKAGLWMTAAQRLRVSDWLQQQAAQEQQRSVALARR